MPHRPRSSLSGLLWAFPPVVGAVLLTWGVETAGFQEGYFFSAAGVAVAAFLGGFRAGLLATVLAGLSSNYLFVEPRYTLDITEPGDRYFFTVFLLEGVFLSALASTLGTPARTDWQGRALAYSAAGGVVAAAVLGKFLLRAGHPDGDEAPELPFALFYAAVLLSAWYGGLGPGLFSLGSATLATGWLFLPAPASLLSSGTGTPAILGLFLLEAAAIVLLGATIHQARQEAAQSQREILRQEDRYRLLVEGVRDHALFLLDADGLVLTWDQGAQRVLGYAPDEILGQHFRVLFPPQEQTAQRPEQHLAMARAQGRCEEPGWCVRRGGERFWAEIYLAAAGEGVGFSVVLRDLSERRRLEEQLVQAQKMEAVGRLAGGVAHDFNNLLTAVLGYSQLLMARLAPEDPLRDDVLEIIGVGERTAQLTRQLLTISRRKAAEPQPLDLNVVVHGLCRVLRRLLGVDIEVREVGGEPLAPVLGDPSHLEQVVLNLAVNARDAMPKGGRLTIETGNVYLDEAHTRAHPGSRPGPHVLLAVTDTGEGMSEEVKAHLFEPFFTTKEEGKGTGLGLATVYGIVRQCAGHVTVESEPGKGTRFRVYLPASGEPAPRRAEASGGDAPRGSETVLLVEDEDYLRPLFRAMLQGSGYQVLEARDGASAQRVCADHTGPIELLIADVVMPGTSGPELAARLRGKRPEMKVLFISGHAEEVIQGLVAPGAAFLQKPFTPDALVRKIRDVLGPG